MEDLPALQRTVAKMSDAELSVCGVLRRNLNQNE
jgi:hypothetical protein